MCYKKYRFYIYTENYYILDDEFSKILDITGRDIQPHKDYLTLGLVGHPNVGKSSLINSIMRRTVVSASRTPGHTKHFQTIHIAHNVRLCDSPGLVFPALIPRALQVIYRSYYYKKIPRFNIYVCIGSLWYVSYCTSTRTL